MAETQPFLSPIAVHGDATLAPTSPARTAPRQPVPPPEPKQAPVVRNHALDNLRALLTALVIAHHTAIVYGGAGGWELHSTCFPPESLPLLLFNAVNQTFFMALFFFLSGRFAWVQLRTKHSSRWDFVKTRMLRILLPAVVFTLLLQPTMEAMVWAYRRREAAAGEAEERGDVQSVFGVYVSYWKTLRGVRGPVWYLVLVMIFDLLAVTFLWNLREPSDGRKPGMRSRIKRRWAPLAWITTISVGFAVRIAYPIGRVFVPLSLLPGYVPQYILAYTGGHLSAIFDDLFILLPVNYRPRRRLRRLFLSLTFLFLCLLASVPAIGVALGKDLEDMSRQLRGGFNGPALFYAIWNDAGFALVGFALVSAVQQHADDEWSVGSVRLARYSYAAFLLHPLVSIGLGLAAEALMRCPAEWDGSRDGVWSVLGPVLVTTVVSLVNVVATWTAGWGLIRIIPRAGKVI